MRLCLLPSLSNSSQIRWCLVHVNLVLYGQEQEVLKVMKRYVNFIQTLLEIIARTFDGYSSFAPAAGLAGCFALCSHLRCVVSTPDVFLFPLSFLNHCIYWATMSPNMESERRRPEGQIEHDINKYFGSFDSFKEEFNKKAKTLFGSGS